MMKDLVDSHAVAFKPIGPDINLVITSYSIHYTKLYELKRWREMLSELHSTRSPDFAMYAVANRELLDLAQSSLRN